MVCGGWWAESDEPTVDHLNSCLTGRCVWIFFSSGLLSSLRVP